MKVVKASKSDVSSIVYLNDTVQSDHAKQHPHIFKYPTNHSEMEHFFSELLDKENQILCVAKNEREEIVGYAWSEVNLSSENPFRYGRRVIYINQIAVNPTHRNAGIGRMLFEYVEEYARQLNLDRIELDSWSFNEEAHSFFGKLGFVKYRYEFWKNINLS